ncbi:restriction endonuclease [Frankia sp. Cpl3]|nr:restriction endonuclease [Frankia sp. Cpl3]
MADQSDGVTALTFDEAASQPEGSKATAPPLITVKKWRDRSNAFAYIPGKSNLQIEALRSIVGQLPKRPTEYFDLISGDGSAKRYPCDDICARQLNASSLVYRDEKGCWRPSDPTAYWYRTADDLYLARYIHANVKLFGELLPHIQAEVQPADLRDVARSFGLHWTSPDQIQRRLNWMQSLGLVERWGFNRLVLTDRGRELLGQIELCRPEVALGQSSPTSDEPVDLPPADEMTADALDGLENKELRARKTLIGYIPRGRKVRGRPAADDGLTSVLEAVRTFVDLVGEGASTNEIFTRAQEQLAQKKSSFTQSMHTFRHMKMVDLISYNRFAATPVALNLLEPGSEVNLVRYIHSRYRYVGEILPLLESSTSVTEIVRVAIETYGLTQIENAEVRTRLGFMADAGLVERIDWTRYRITALGRMLAAELPLEEAPEGSDPSDSRASVDPPSEEDRASAFSIVRSELRQFSRSRDHSLEFEQTIARAFELLGFRAEHHGGSGKTDVLVTAELPPMHKYRSIIDAKASATGVIGDNAVKFDAIKDHKKRHKADFGMVVGPDFEGRVKEWAANNGIALLTVEELIGILERHQLTPLTLLDMKGLFEHPGISLAEIDELYDAAHNSVALIAKIVALLYQEANDEDPIGEGYMSLENLHYAIRKELSPRPSQKIVNEALTFLASSLVKAVASNGERYKLVDSPSNIRRRLCGLGVGLDKIDVEGSGA